MAKSDSKSRSKKPATRAADIDIGLSATERGAIAGGLARLLADTYTLYLTTHNFHWNVTGPKCAFCPRPFCHPPSMLCSFGTATRR